MHQEWAKQIFIAPFFLPAIPHLSLPGKWESSSPLMHVQCSRHGVHHHTYYNTKAVTSTVHWGKEETRTGQMLQSQLLWEWALDQSHFLSAEFIIICFNMPLICSLSNRFQAALDREEESKWPKWEQVKTVIVITTPNIIPTHFKWIIFKAEVYLLSVSVSVSSTLATFIRGLFEEKKKGGRFLSFSFC